MFVGFPPSDAPPVRTLEEYEIELAPALRDRPLLVVGTPARLQVATALGVMLDTEGRLTAKRLPRAGVAFRDALADSLKASPEPLDPDARVRRLMDRALAIATRTRADRPVVFPSPTAGVLDEVLSAISPGDILAVFERGPIAFSDRPNAAQSPLPARVAETIAREVLFEERFAALSVGAPPQTRGWAEAVAAPLRAALGYSKAILVLNPLTRERFGAELTLYDSRGAIRSRAGRVVAFPSPASVPPPLIHPESGSETDPDGPEDDVPYRLASGGPVSAPEARDYLRSPVRSEREVLARALRRLGEALGGTLSGVLDEATADAIVALPPRANAGSLYAALSERCTLTRVSGGWRLSPYRAEIALRTRAYRPLLARLAGELPRFDALAASARASGAVDEFQWRPGVLRLLKAGRIVRGDPLDPEAYVLPLRAYAAAIPDLPVAAFRWASQRATALASPLRPVLPALILAGSEGPPVWMRSEARVETIWTTRTGEGEAWLTPELLGESIQSYADGSPATLFDLARDRWRTGRREELRIRVVRSDGAWLEETLRSGAIRPDPPQRYGDLPPSVREEIERNLTDEARAAWRRALNTGLDPGTRRAAR